MSKLEDKLSASIKKSEQPKTAAPVQATETKPATSAKIPAAKKTGKKTATKKVASKAKNAGSSAKQSALHPQRIWPD